MYSASYQLGKQVIELLSNAGTNPSAGWKMTPNVHRVYDKSCKGYVYLLEKAKNASLSLHHPIFMKLNIDSIQDFLNLSSIIYLEKNQILYDIYDK